MNENKYSIIKVGELYLDNFWSKSGIGLAPKDKARRFNEERLKDVIAYLNDNNIPFKVIQVIITEVESMVN